MQDERLIRIREEEVQEHLDGLPTALRDMIHEFIPDSEFVIGYEKDDFLTHNDARNE